MHRNANPREKKETVLSDPIAILKTHNSKKGERVSEWVGE